jgi:hypothetical protein
MKRTIVKTETSQGLSIQNDQEKNRLFLMKENEDIFIMNIGTLTSFKGDG